MLPFSRFFQFVQGIDIGIDRRYYNICIGTLSADDTTSFFKSNGDFTLSICTTGNIIHRIQLQLRITADDTFYRSERSL